jgi:hypothetical protein
MSKYQPIPEKEQYAIFNKVIYADKKNWNKELKKYNLDKTYTIDKKLSTANTMVLVNSTDKKVIVVHSGTDLKRRAGEDLLTDVGIGLNLSTITPRYNKSKKITESAMKKYNDYETISTGFSLGGAVSSNISKDLGIESHSFNPGVSPINLRGNIENLLKQKKDTKSNVYMTTSDWISISGLIDPSHKTNYVKNKKGEAPHSIDNFIGDFKTM